MAHLRLKVLIASNFEPEISSQAADRSRLFWITVEKSQNVDDPTWETRLGQEMPHFLHYCREQYNLLCPSGGNITLPKETNDLIDSASDQDEFEELFDRLLQVSPGNRLKGLVLSKALQSEGKDKLEISAFKTWLTNFKDCKRIRSNGTNFTNIELKA